MLQAFTDLAKIMTPKQPEVWTTFPDSSKERCYEELEGVSNFKLIPAFANTQNV